MKLFKTGINEQYDLKQELDEGDANQKCTRGKGGRPSSIPPFKGPILDGKYMDVSKNHTYKNVMDFLDESK